MVSVLAAYAQIALRKSRAAAAQHVTGSPLTPVVSVRQACSSLSARAAAVLATHAPNGARAVVTTSALFALHVLTTTTERRSTEETEECTMILDAKARGKNDLRDQCQKLTLTAEHEADAGLLAKLYEVLMEGGTGQLSEWLHAAKSGKGTR